MNAPMPRSTTKAKPRPVAATNPNTAVLYTRVPAATADALDAWVNELNAAAEAAGDPRRWTKNDVVNAVLGRRLRERKPGDAP